MVWQIAAGHQQIHMSGAGTTTDCRSRAVYGVTEPSDECGERGDSRHQHSSQKRTL